MCFNCLRTGHIVSKCRSIFSCRQCKKRHHTLLHLQPSDNSEASAKNYSITTENSTTASSEELPTTAGLSDKSLDHSGEAYTSLTCVSQCSILPTVIIKVADSLGTFQQCRALLDSGSQTNFISESCMQRLKLTRNRSNIQFSGLANTNAGAANGMAHIIARSIYDSTCKLSMTAYILDKLTAFIPSSTIYINFKEQLKNLNLADPQFHKPNQIDLIIGAEFFFHILKAEKKIIDNAIIQNTIFGWTIAGKTTQTSLLNQSYTTMIISDNDVIDNTLQKFWEVENLPAQRLRTNEEIKAEDIYAQTTTRDKTGRLVVTLPFKENHPTLGNTYQMALSRLLAMERKFLRDPKLKDDYTKFMNEYIQLGHMKRISDRNSGFNYFLPHHCVFKQSSETTKLRVVFDGSAKPASGSPINPCLLVGPNLQLTLYELLLQFRKYKYGICGDIEKMYRQILIDENYTQYQNILWRESEMEEVGHYKLLTVTYGMASSSFLAVRSLVEIANQNSFIKYAELLNNHFYVDDLLAGADNHSDAILVRSELDKVLNTAGMHLRKWKSNSDEFMKTIKDDDQHAAVTFDEASATAKILGLQWNYKEDTFTFKINISSDIVATKRVILSESSRIFDPLGFVAPCTLAIKVLLQRLWLKKLGWDEQIPVELEAQWATIRQNLKKLDNLKIPRYFLNANSKVVFQGFSDASELGYAAVVYIISTNSSGHTTAVLAAAKTKVAPLKQISVPRLELCGALLLARLMQSIDNTLKIDNVRKIAWTDSTTVLHWLADFPRRWKTFVGNRTSEILSIIPKENWNYIASSDNPADCASRGQNPEDLVKNQLWWNGPEWLQLNETLWPKLGNIPKPNSRADTERRVQALCNQLEVVNPTCVNEEIYELFLRYSTYQKLIRVFAFIFRFISNCRSSNPSRIIKNQLLISELEHSNRFVIRISQAKSFAEEIKCLHSQTQLNKKSILLQLHPFIDQNNLLRVGGRIQKAQTDYDHKHQIIMPKECIISILILEDIHRKYCHAGATFMINSARLKYWIIGVRSLAKRITNKCVVCFRQRAVASNQLMGNLPSARLIHSIRPFVNTGVDYAGPIKLRCDKIRSTATWCFLYAWQAKLFI